MGAGAGAGVWVDDDGECSARVGAEGGEERVPVDDGIGAVAGVDVEWEEDRGGGCVSEEGEESEEEKGEGSGGHCARDYRLGVKLSTG